MGVIRDARGLLLVSASGFFRPGHPAQPEFDEKINRFAIDKRVACNITLADGTVVVGTLDAGLMWLSPAGRILRLLDSSNGLPTNSIFSIMEDSAGCLWCSSFDGSTGSSPMVPSPSSIAGTGSPNPSANIAVVGTRAFVGTGSGVFQLTPNPARGAHATLQAELGQGFRAVQPYRNGFLLGRHGGLDFHDGNSLANIYSLDANGVMDIYKSRLDAGRYWLTESHGLTRLEAQPGDSFTHSRIFTPTDNPQGGIHEDTAGGLWFGTGGQGLFAHDLNKGVTRAISDPDTGQPFKEHIGLDNSGDSFVFFADGKFLQANPDATGLRVLKRIPTIDSYIVRALAGGRQFITAFRRVGASGTSAWGQGLGLLTLQPDGNAAWQEFDVPRAGRHRLRADPGIFHGERTSHPVAGRHRRPPAA